ncbi:MlaD family protein [Nocardia flavorosea]|nr:MlaD family protein [Nocardia flavorosea]
MPSYVMSGSTMTRKNSVLTGLGATALALVVLLGWLGGNAASTDDRMRITVRTEHLGDGIADGTPVRVRGFEIGEIVSIVAAGGNGQQLELALDRSRVFELTDRLQMNYAPANLFGITELDLVPGTGGAPLRDGTVVDLTGPRATDVYDATLSALLRNLSGVAGGALTPQLTDTMYRLSRGLTAFTPLLRAIVALAGVVADAQRLPASFLAGEFGRAAGGAGAFAAATVEVFDVIRSNRPLREDRPHFDATVDAIVNDLLPAAVALGNTGERHLTGYTEILVPLLDSAAAMVPRPDQSSAELRALLTRLDSAFAPGPDGPVLGVSTTLHGVPVLAQSVLGTAIAQAGQGPR